MEGVGNWQGDCVRWLTAHMSCHMTHVRACNRQVSDIVGQRWPWVCSTLLYPAYLGGGKMRTALWCSQAYSHVAWLVQVSLVGASEGKEGHKEAHHHVAWLVHVSLVGASEGKDGHKEAHHHVAWLVQVRARTGTRKHIIISPGWCK